MENEFLRYEFKYPVQEKIIPAVRKMLNVYGMQSDPRVLRGGGHTYPVTSLYFDSPERVDYYDKSGGFLSRKKLRVRIYEKFLHDKVETIFLEKKMKYDMNIRKIRSPITLIEYNELIKGRALNLLQNEGYNPIVREIVGSICSGRSRPHLVVQYMREPLVSATKPHFRVTFDTHITACKSHDLHYNHSHSLKEVAPGSAVMEIKYEMFLPSWFGRVLDEFGLVRETFSKYALGLEVASRFNRLPR